VVLGIFLLLGESVGHAAHAHGVQLLDGLLVRAWFSLVNLLNHRRVGLRWGIEVIGAADVVMVHGRLHRRIARYR